MAVFTISRKAMRALSNGKPKESWTSRQGEGAQGLWELKVGHHHPKGREDLSNERLEPSVKTNKFSEETGKPRGPRQRAKDSRTWCIH